MKWLTSVEQEAWIVLQVCAAALEHASDRQLQRDAGIPYTTYAILAALSQSEGGLRHMSDLAGIAGHSQSRLSHAVARLESDGLVRRRRCPHDKRAVHAELTDAGRRLIEQAAPAHVTAVRELVFDRLTAEQSAQLAESLLVLYRLLVEDGVAPSIPALLTSPTDAASEGQSVV